MNGVRICVSLGLPVIVAVSACTVDLAVPPAAQIACTQDSQCPDGFACMRATGLCVSLRTNQPPTVAIGNVERSTAVVAIPVTVFDAESDSVQFVVQLDRGAGLEPISVTPASAIGSPSGETLALLWDAATFFGRSTLQTDLVIHVAAQDATSTGPEAVSIPFCLATIPRSSLTLPLMTTAPAENIEQCHCSFRGQRFFRRPREHYSFPVLPHGRKPRCGFGNHGRRSRHGLSERLFGRPFRLAGRRQSQPNLEFDATCAQR